MYNAVTWTEEPVAITFGCGEISDLGTFERTYNVGGTSRKNTL